MQIYVLLRQDYEGSETVCVSEDINKIHISICQDLDEQRDYMELEIWKNGEQIYRTTGSDVLKKVVEMEVL